MNSPLSKTVIPYASTASAVIRLKRIYPWYTHVSTNMDRNLQFADDCLMRWGGYLVYVSQPAFAGPTGIFFSHENVTGHKSLSVSNLQSAEYDCDRFHQLVYRIGLLQKTGRILPGETPRRLGFTVAR